jgi:DNA-directed RNA polymerase subunit RPC12/RpoP
VEREKLVTVATFSDVLEAKIVQSMLESEGISCFVQDENIIGINWMLSAAVGGVKLKVRESDLNEASLLLSENAKMIMVPEFASDERAQSSNDAVRCPECGSDNVVREQLSKRAFFLSWIFLGFPIPFFSNSYRCLSCNRTWKKEKRG